MKSPKRNKSSIRWGKYSSQLVFSTEVSVVIIECIFANCHLLTVGECGAAILNTGVNTFNVKRCTFVNTTTPKNQERGAAIYRDNGNFNLKQTCFSHCYSWDNGGAICFSRGISVFQEGLSFSLVHFTRCGAEDTFQDAVAYIYGDKPLIVNVNSSNNKAQSASALTIRTNTIANISWSAFENNSIGECLFLSGVFSTTLVSNFYFEKTNFVQNIQSAFQFESSSCSYYFRDCMFVDSSVFTGSSNAKVVLYSCYLNEDPSSGIGHFQSDLSCTLTMSVQLLSNVELSRVGKICKRSGFPTQPNKICIRHQLGMFLIRSLLIGITKL